MTIRSANLVIRSRRAALRLPVVSGEDDDLPDPVQSPIEAFRRCATEIQSMVDVMIGLISPIQTVRQ